MKFDLYRQPYKLLLPDGKNEYRTFGGSILSLCTILAVVGFAVIRIIAVASRADHKVQSQKEENYFADTDVLSENDGFLIAAAITGYDGK